MTEIYLRYLGDRSEIYLKSVQKMLKICPVMGAGLSEIFVDMDLGRD